MEIVMTYEQFKKGTIGKQYDIDLLYRAQYWPID